MGWIGRNWPPPWIPGKYRQYVLDEHQAAKDLGIFGTPTYRINGGEPDFGDKSVAEMTEMIAGGA